MEAQTAVLAMAGTQSENLASETAEMHEAAGAVDTAFQRQTNTLNYTIQTVKNLGKNFLTQIGTNILPYVNDLAKAALPKAQSALEQTTPRHRRSDRTRRAAEAWTRSLLPQCSTSTDQPHRNRPKRRGKSVLRSSSACISK